MRLENGYYFPAGDCALLDYRKYDATPRQAITALEEYALQLTFKLLPKIRRHTVVQAGGHVGVMARVFAHHFQSVVTFEPDAQQRECLIRNLEGLTNVKVVPAALMHKSGTADLLHNTECSGMSFILPPGVHDAHALKVLGYESHTNKVDCMALDWLGLMACDLLMLDIEGCELFAIRGAVDTIYKHRPIIVAEVNNRMKIHGFTKQDLDSELANMGYAELPSRIFAHDAIYTYKGGT